MRVDHSAKGAGSNAARLRSRVSTLLAAALWLAAACEAPRTTQVIVILDAEPSLRAQARALDVSVSGPDGLVLQRRVDPSVVGTWPYRVPIIPALGDATRGASLEARLADGAGAALGVERAAFEFTRGELRYVRLTFRDACRDLVCGDTERCVAGGCVRYCVAPTQSEETEVESGPCPAFSADVDAGTRDAGVEGGIPDAALTDASDASLDAALDASLDAAPEPPRVRCPAELRPLSFVDEFDAPSEVPPRCGAPRCETSSAGRVDQLSESSASFTPGEAACGSGALRLQIGAGPTAAPTAFVTYPSNATLGSTVALRAWVYLDAPLGQEFALMGAAFDTAHRDSDIADGTTLVLESSGLLALVDRAPGEVERRSSLGASLPPSTWTCLELVVSLDAGAVEGFIDGLSVARIRTPRRAGASADAIGALRVGLFSVPDASVTRTLWVDGLIIDGARHPCPSASP